MRRKTSVLEFLTEVRAELGMVEWPNRISMVSYTQLVLATITVMTAGIFGLDYLFSKVILNLLSS